MLTTIDIPEVLRNQKINIGMTWLGVIKTGLNSGIDRHKMTELEEDNRDLRNRIVKLQELLDKYVKLSQNQA